MTIKTNSQDSVLTIYLNRPELHNAFNPQMIKELTSVFLKESKNHRLIILKGEGKSFCAGADLSWMQSMVKYSRSQNKQDALKLHKLFEAIKNSSCPVLAKVHGNVFAGGLGLVAAADIVVAENSTQFCFSEPKLGLVPAVISTFVALKMNASILREVFLTAEIFDVQKAKQSGLIHFFGTTEQCDEEIENKIKMILKCGPDAISKTKKLLNLLPNNNYKKLKAITTQMIAEVRVSAEGQEGIKSFLEKRKPKWLS